MGIIFTICTFLSPLAIWLIAGGKDSPKWLKIILGIVQLLIFLVYGLRSLERIFN